MSVEVIHGDCLEVMREMPESSVDAIVTDPPYGLEFMGKEWDRFGKPADVARSLRGETSGLPIGAGSGRGTSPTAGRPGFDLSLSALMGFQTWCQEWAVEALRVLKPGGFLLSFGGTRTYHRMVCGVEDAGFEIRDTLTYLHGVGFPKSHNISKAIDKAAGAKREVVEQRRVAGGGTEHINRKNAETYGYRPDGYQKGGNVLDVTAPATDAAKKWEGWGTALKPAAEFIVVARKPLIGTVAQNILTHGVGGLNIDGCRVTASESLVRPSIVRTDNEVYGKGLGAGAQSQPTGRWPANVLLGCACEDEHEPECAVRLLDEQSGRRKSPKPYAPSVDRSDASMFGIGGVNHHAEFGDSGGASRFFYTAKASRSERGEGNSHPTVKPLSLCRWLVRLVTPPGGTVLDPFSGSGTTLIAARQEGFSAIGIEREHEYFTICQKRLAVAQPPLEEVS